MNAYKIEVQLQEDGQLVLSGLPFTAGAMVEVIVLEQPQDDGSTNVLLTVPNKQMTGVMLQSTVPLQAQYRYDDPFEPALPLEDWDVLS